MPNTNKYLFNWKTSLSGIIFIGALCGFLAGMTDTVSFLAPIKEYLLFIAAVSGFVNSYFQKDKDVTGGNIKQD